MTNKNLMLWNKVCKTPKEKTKQVSQGRKYTTVNPQYQIRCATEQFGSYGSTWGFKSIENETMQIEDEILLTIKAVFFYPSGEFPITNSNKLLAIQKRGPFLDTDAYKKLETDTLTKALSRLGFNADIFEGLYDNVDYLKGLESDSDLKNTNEIYKASLPMATDIQYKKTLEAVKKGDIKKYTNACRVVNFTDQQHKEINEIIESIM